MWEWWTKRMWFLWNHYLRINVNCTIMSFCKLADTFRIFCYDYWASCLSKCRTRGPFATVKRTDSTTMLHNRDGFVSRVCLIWNGNWAGFHQIRAWIMDKFVKIGLKSDPKTTKLVYGTLHNRNQTSESGDIVRQIVLHGGNNKNMWVIGRLAPLAE